MTSKAVGNVAVPAAKTGYASKRALWMISLVLVAVTAAVFWPVGTFDFFHYDDTTYFSENFRVLNGLNWSNVQWAFEATVNSSWYPLMWLSFMLDVTLFGKGPTGPHLVNLAFHIANVVLLFHLLHRTTGATWRSAAVACLFAIHPLHVESVAWIAERKDVLSTFFGFLTLVCYAGYVQRKDKPARHPEGRERRAATLRYWLALVFFALGLLSKPMLVTLPCVMLLMDYWPLKRVALVDWRRGVRRLVLEKTPFFLLSVASGCATLWVHRQSGAMSSLDEFPIGLRFQNAFVSLARYLGKSFWPVNLAVPYPYPVDGRWPLWLVALGVLLAVCLSAGAVWLAVRRPYVFTGWFWFLGTLFPVIGIIQWGGHSMADRFTYVPLIGFFILVVWGISDLWERWRLPVVLGGVAAGMVGLACAWRASDQVWLWRDTETLFRHTLAVTGNNEVALSNLGVCMAARERWDDAINLYHRALAINPRSAETLGNLAVALVEKGEYEEASARFRESIALAPDRAVFHLNYGNTLLELGRMQEAMAALHTAIRVEPDHPRAHSDLGRAYAEQERFDDAIREYAIALQINPGYAEAEHNWGLALAEQGRLDEAMVRYHRALKLDPNFIEIHNSLGSALLASGRVDEAIRELQSLLTFKPDHAKALDNLGIAQASKGQLTEAMQTFEKALLYSTNVANIRYNLGNVLVMRRELEAAAVEFREAVRVDPGHAAAH
ncbi:MAG TPA: tetratricopeptide repeat protein, partial [Verrucomicrobiota bacterium]|nr:tetratricopeptide repeat protein [Verrucomicrobiota bacterium]